MWLPKLSPPATADANEAETLLKPGIDNMPPISTLPEAVISLPIKLPLALILPCTVSFSLGVLVPIPIRESPPVIKNKWVSLSPSTLKSLYKPTLPWS